MSALRAPLHTLRTLLGVFRIQFRESVQYRAAALSGTVISTVWCLIEIAIFHVFYLYADNAGAGVAAGLTLEQAVTYKWLSQFVLILQINPSATILRQIDRGDIGVELLRPFPLYNLWYARTAADRLAPLPLRGGVMLLIAMLLPGAYRLGGPASPAALLCALFSLLCAVLLTCSFNTLMLTVRMNIAWGSGPMNTVLLLGQMLSGAWLPLQLWPGFMQSFLLIQPFAGYVDIPVRLYLGVLPVGDAWLYWLLQLLWTAVFVALGRLNMGRHLRTIVLQGG